MPDLAMCIGGECPLKAKCFRYTARPFPQQAWLDTPPFKGNECEFFIRKRETKQKVSK